MRIYKIDSTDNTSFGRKFTQKELQIYTNSVNEGLKLLNKQVDIIIHNSAAPAIKEENTGIGSLFSKTVQEKLIPFLKAHGITGIQQEPNNLRKAGDPSPYAPESSAKNIYMIPLEKLTTEKYGKILPKSYFDFVVNNNPNRDLLKDISGVIHNPDKDRVNYDYVNRQYDNALHFAYKKFKTQSFLQPEFAEFKRVHQDDLEKAALYRILDNTHKTNWKNWPEMDRTLFCPENELEEKMAKTRIAELKLKHRDEIDYFMFQQFLIDMENKESNELAKKTGVKIIGDSPVASPEADEWINQKLLLQGKAIGCPPDYFSKDGQRWGFGYFNPKYIFNPDGTLGKAGKILKEKYDKFFSSFPGGLRIDHVIGLVDPFIYTVNSEKMTAENSGRIYSVNGEFKKKPKEYADILEKIVLQSAKDHGMDKTNIICEDLGDPNKPTQKVMKDLDLSGIAVTQFDYRGSETPERNVIMIGSHDNKSFLEYISDFFGKVKGFDIHDKSLLGRLKATIVKKQYENNKDLKHFLTKTRFLAQDTVPKDATKEQFNRYKQQIRRNKSKFLEASFTELFTSPARRIQIFFADFWGIGKTYNTPGTSKGNWELRIPSDFENEYYNAVSCRRAPNLAASIAAALRHRGLDKEHPELMKNLDNSAKILYEM